jgi:hypothetical protein
LAENLPCEQLTQEGFAVLLAYLPAAHKEQTELDAANLPSAQGLHAIIPAFVVTYPVAQVIQELAAKLAWYLPSGHAVHPDIPV